MQQDITLYRFANPGEIMLPGTLRVLYRQDWTIIGNPPGALWFPNQPMFEGLHFIQGTAPALIPLPYASDSIRAASAALIDGTLYRRLKDDEVVTKVSVLISQYAAPFIASQALVALPAANATWGLNYEGAPYFTPVLANAAPKDNEWEGYRVANTGDALIEGSTFLVLNDEGIIAGTILKSGNNSPYHSSMGPCLIPVAQPIDGTIVKHGYQWYRLLQIGEKRYAGSVYFTCEDLTGMPVDGIHIGLTAEEPFAPIFAPMRKFAEVAKEDTENWLGYKIAREGDEILEGSKCVTNAVFGWATSTVCIGMKHTSGMPQVIIPVVRLSDADVLERGGCWYRKQRVGEKILKGSVRLGAEMEDISDIVIGILVEEPFAPIFAPILSIFEAVPQPASPFGWLNGVHAMMKDCEPDPMLANFGENINPASKPWYYDTAVSLLPEGYEVCEHCDLGISLIFGVVSGKWHPDYPHTRRQDLLYARAKMEVDSRPVYRFLDKGETIQAGDEVRLKTSFIGWVPSGVVGGRHINPGAMEYRRQVGTMNDLQSKQK